MKRQQTPLEILESVGAVIKDDHLVYTSGKHGSAYVNKDALYPHTGKTARLCKLMAQRVHDSNQIVDVVVAPAIGAVILSYAIAYQLSRLSRREVFCAYAEKTGAGKDDPFVLKRGYETLVKGKNVLLVEDILNTGGSAKRVVDAVSAEQGDVVAMAALCNRGGVTKSMLGLRETCLFFSLVEVQLDAWDEADCPLCRENKPINTTIGKGREYLARKQQS